MNLSNNPPAPSANSVHKLHLKTAHGAWAFDDAERDLVNEPFVGDTNTIIDAAILGNTDATALEEMRWKRVHAPEPVQFTNHYLWFSVSQPPTSLNATECKFVRREGDWSTYEAFGLKGPLCPALLKFYNPPPPSIWIWVTEE